MSATRSVAALTVLAGTFDSQPAAFARLLDAATRSGIDVDLADVDVIQAASEVRLAHYFRPAIVARIEEARGADNTLIVIRPSVLSALPGFPAPGYGLRTLGRFAGEIIEAGGADDSWL